MLVGLILACVPFVFGILRFAETRSDTRYLWTALASLVGAVVVASSRAWAQRPLAAHLLVAFLAAAMCAALSARLQHVTFGPAMVIVSCAFGPVRSSDDFDSESFDAASGATCHGTCSVSGPSLGGGGGW